MDITLRTNAALSLVVCDSHVWILHTIETEFHSDNGPWLAEQSCSGARGPWKGQWLANNVDQNCTACPHDYVPDPTLESPRRCRLKMSSVREPKDDSLRSYLDGVHCGEDVGLGSLWEVRTRNRARMGKWGILSVGILTPTLLFSVGQPKDASIGALSGKD